MASEATAILDCRGVEKSWGGVHAVAGMDLMANRGEILGLAGANGAGKSTLLNLIGGQAAPTNGRIEFNGRRLEHLSPQARRWLGLGRTFQTIRVFASKSVMLNVILAAHYGQPHRLLPPLRFSENTNALARAAIGRFGLEGLEHARAGELSVYEQKRLMLAMADVPEPDLVLLDEPAGGLSPKEVDETTALLRRIRERGTTIVLVDHVISFLTAVADRMVVVHEGAILCTGPPDTVVRDPRVRETWLGHGTEARR